MYGANYLNGQSGTTSVSGLLDEVGAFDGNSPLGGDEFLIWEILFTADAVGTQTFASDFADISPLHDVTLADDTTMAVPEAAIDFGMISLEILKFAANDDSFFVLEDSVNNPLDVLDNDTLGKLGGMLEIVDVDDFSDGGSATLGDGTILAYTPATSFTGRETFTYTVVDGMGGIATATVTIDVSNLNNDPTARDDMFGAIEDSAIGVNVFDVLMNDDSLPDTGETLTIIDVESPASGGVAVIVGDRINYAPGRNFFGNDTFEYTISDGNGGTDTAVVTVSVVNTNDNPDAMNDDLSVSEDSIENFLDVLDNDSFLPDPPETLTVIAVGMTNQGGTAEPSPDGSGIVYTPAAGFLGTETFTYTISDGNGGMDTAQVTVDVEKETLVLFRIEPTDLGGTPIDSIAVGGEFMVRVWAEHTKATAGPNSGGVFAGYLDMLYGSQFVSVDGPIEHGPLHGNGISGDTSTPGLIDEVGGFDGFSPIGPGESSLFEVPFVADSTGQFAFSSNAAEASNHIVLVHGSNDPVASDKIDFGSFTFDVTAAFSAFTNYANPVDVDADGEVTPFDALLIINEINRGTVELGSPKALAQSGGIAMASAALIGETAEPVKYIDVDGDGQLTPMDALMVINVLNSASSTSQESGAMSASASLLADVERAPSADAANHSQSSAATSAQLVDNSIGTTNAVSTVAWRDASTRVVNRPNNETVIDDPRAAIDFVSDFFTETQTNKVPTVAHSIHGARRTSHIANQDVTDLALDAILNDIANDITDTWSE